MLLGGRQPGVEREDLGVAEVPLGQCVGGVADLALAGQEDEDVAPEPVGTALTLEFGDGVADGDIDAPTIGVEPSSVSQSAVGVWSASGMSTVDDIETPAGRLALALLLSGSTIGNYGLKETADDGIVPQVEPQPSE